PRTVACAIHFKNAADYVRLFLVNAEVGVQPRLLPARHLPHYRKVGVAVHAAPGVVALAGALGESLAGVLAGLNPLARVHESLHPNRQLLPVADLHLPLLLVVPDRYAGSQDALDQ